MEVKTPGQIATEVQQNAPLNANEWEMMVRAIEADRAQPRCELRHTLPSGQTINVWIGTSGADGSALVQIDTADSEGNVRVFINDSDHPVYDENPETGQYEGLEPRECDACGDEVYTLSSDDLCDGCVAEGMQRCPNCGEWRSEGEMNHWPNLQKPISMCDSCEHDARRNGWEPGQ